MKNADFMTLLAKQLDELVKQYPTELKTPERAFIAWTLMHLQANDIASGDAVAAIVDGAQEKGIDAIYVPDRNGRIIILQTKYHKNPEKHGIKKNDLVKLFAGIDWLMRGDLGKITGNPQFAAKAEEFRDAYVNFEYSEIVVALAATAEKGPGKEELDEIEHALDGFRESGAAFEVITLSVNELHGALISAVHNRYKLAIDINFAGKPFHYEREKSGARAIVGAVKGVELAQLFHKHSFRIFDANIRNYLGMGKINQEIQRTATDKDEACNFWFYNNGVTFVCDEYSFRSLEDTVVKMRNAQIINGCQTVMSLYNSGRELKDDVEVLVRIIEKEQDLRFFSRIALCANSQNAVRPADLVGTDTIQLELKRLMLKYGVYYETRRGDYRAEKDTLSPAPSEVITMKKAAQALATVFMQKPGIAKKDTSRLFLSSTDGGLYDHIFTAATIPEQVIAACRTMDAVEIERKRREAESFVSGISIPNWIPHSDHFMTGLLFWQAFNKEKAADPDYLLKFADWVSQPSNTDLQSRYKSIMDEVDKIVVSEAQNYGYSHPWFFKTQPVYDIRLRPIVTINPI
ncbi:MAG: AIPR family protein [Candidatus Brocadiales bacterium]|nr:AIPR family protein [Candidatus Brocadiales bacterium]